MFKVNNRITRTSCQICLCLKLTIKTPERRSFGVFVVNFKHISHLVLVFLLLTLNRYIPAGLKRIPPCNYKPVLNLQDEKTKLTRTIF